MRFISLAIKPAFAIALMEPEERYISLNGTACEEQHSITVSQVRESFLVLINNL
jgi:hypothetical protein